jgi:hypothetical protein
MSTATDTAAEAPTLSQEYLSSCNNLRLRREPIRKKQLGEGTDFTTTDGDGVEFINGRLIASDPGLIEWLDNHPSNGTLFHKVGFGADGNTADNSAQLISEVVKLAFQGEYQRIADIMIAERNTYKRPDVIAACETVLNEVAGSTPA